MTREERKEQTKALHLMRDFLSSESILYYQRYAKGMLTSTEAARLIAMTVISKTGERKA